MAKNDNGTITFEVSLDTSIVRNGRLNQDIGIETLGGAFSKLLTRNSELPCSFIQEFSTADDQQTAITIKIYAGVSTSTWENRFLGELQVHDIPALARGITKIYVGFSIQETTLRISVSGYDGITGHFTKTEDLESQYSVTSQGLCPNCLQKLRLNLQKTDVVYVCPRCKTDLQLLSNGTLKPIEKKPESRDIKEVTKNRKDSREQEVPKVDIPQKVIKSKDGQAQLQGLIGLQTVKNEVQSLIDFIKVQKAREKLGKQTPEISKHLVFLGNPGTGKTTVARIIAQIYFELGICSIAKVIETDRSGLVGEYVGHTAVKTKAKIAEAMGGVLFIDEAYSLTPAESSNDFGSEAVDTLLKEMEDHRNDLVVIVAGYPEEMNRFIKSNPGLESRFNQTIEFTDYSPSEMNQIFLELCKKNEYEIADGCELVLNQYFEDIYRNRDSSFANGRTVRNFFELVIRNHARRISPLMSSLERSQLSIFEPEDISRSIQS
jgi:SpoVK/Ycf46/Vps4 family AAA+-type ATPase